MTADNTCIVIPAAGASTRFGAQNKLLRSVEKRPLLARTLERACGLGVAGVIVVAGHDSDRVEALTSGFPATCIVNEHFTQGMASSIARGVSACEPWHNVMIWPGDMPAIQIRTARRLLHKAAADAILVPVYEGRRGHPVTFGSDLRPQLLRLSGVGGARSILEANPSRVIEIPVTDAGTVFDVDTESDLEALIERIEHRDT